MKTTLAKRLFASLFFVCILNIAFIYKFEGNELSGAWKLKNGNDEHVLIFIDDYYTHTAYNKNDRKFEYTRGGKYSAEKDKLFVQYEFDTKQKDQVGQTVPYDFSVASNQLSTTINGKKENWTRIDNGTENLAGLWRITGRKQEDKIVQVHQTGPRKTVKILSGSRFQWAAINPATKEFFGTGGGNYTLKNGQYTENIEFFSRDSSRVGASLSFDGKLEEGAWHHSGLSSKGDPIYEIWSRVK